MPTVIVPTQKTHQRSSSARRVAWLAGIMAITLLVAQVISLVLLMGVVEREGRERLVTTARNLSELVEAVARFDAIYSQQDHPQGSTGATLSQIEAALHTSEGEDLEILLARRDGAGVAIVLGRHVRSITTLAADAPAATVFLAGLAGKSGDATTVDLTNQPVFAAYRPLPTLKMALVVQEAVSEMRRPVLQAGLVAGLLALLVGGIGVYLGQRQTTPLLSEIAAYAEANRAKSTFLSNMSHEIRTPLNAIVGLLHLLRSCNLTGKAAGYLRQMDSSSASLQRLINDVLDLSKIEAGMMVLDRSRFRLDALLETVASQLSVQVNDKPVELLFSIDPSLPLELDGDALRLQQVLINLTTNAVKFTERGSVVVEALLAGRVGDEATIRFSVRDTGIGIAPEDLKRLFEKFTQVDASASRRYGGWGLGLAISKELVALMGGELSVTSTPGVGTTFSFIVRMPAAKGDLAKRFTLPAGLAGLHVLVIDDLALSRDLLRALLQAFGCQVTCAANGAEGLALWRAAAVGKPIRLALVDWRMPDIDGLEVIRRLQAGDHGIVPPKTILITGANRAALRDEDLAGLDGFLLKPVDPSSLFNALISAIGSDKARPPTAEGSLVVADTLFGKGRHLLVAEDHEINQTIIRELLLESGFTVDVAGDGQLAVTAAQNTRYDAVLMDIHMPNMDGMAATRLLRADPRTKDLPIIALTADAMVESQEQFHAAGMDDVVAKPINVERLLAVLQRHLKKRPLLDPGAAIWDQAAGIRRTGGNAALYQRLVQSFATQEIGATARIREAWQAGDLSKADDMVHALKGVAGNLGLGRLADAAAKLHDHWHLKRPGDTAALLAEFDTALTQALTSITAAKPCGNPV